MVVPLAKEWLELEKETGGRQALHGTPEELWAQYNALLEYLIPMMPPPSPNVEAKDGEVDGIKYRVYTPKEAAGKGPLPVGVWTHGGGWLLGDLNGEDLLCRAVAEFAPAVIVSVDYRMAPDHKWPVMLDDSLTVFKWAQKNAASLGGDPKKFFTIGGSAGGNLALTVANRLISTGEKSNIHGIVAIVPAVVHYSNVPEEYKAEYKAFEENGPDAPILSQQSMDDFFKHAGAKPDDKSMWPLLTPETHKDYPATYIVTCGADPLRDDGVVMEAALKKAGVPVKRDHYEGLPHYFWIYPQIPQGQQFVGNLIGGAQWVIGQMS